MVMSISDLTVELTANEQSITIEGGFSEDSDAVMFETIPIVSDPRVGADGSVAYFRSPNRGGNFTLKLLPNAPQVPWLMEQYRIVKDRGQVRWSGRVEDRRMGVTTTMSNGQLLDAQPFPSYGVGAVSNYEFNFHFAVIDPDYSTVSSDAFVVQHPQSE